jgi:hypothetical protein
LTYRQEFFTIVCGSNQSVHEEEAMEQKRTRRGLLEFYGALSAYALVLAGSVWLLNSSRDAAWRIPVALAPVVPAVLMVLAFVREFGRMDELQQRIHSEGLAFGFGGALVTTFGYGFLEFVGFPHLNWIFVWPVMMAFWGIGIARARRRYR